MQFDRRYSRSVEVPANPDAVFRFLDDPVAVAGHMANGRRMLVGTTMKLRLDQAQGRALGAEIVLSGRVLGRRLEVRQRVCLRQPPWRKTWETVGAPILLVIGAYRLGFELTPTQRGCASAP